MIERKSFPGERWLRITVRTIHIGGAGILLGATVLDGASTPGIAWAVAAVSGLLFMVHDLWRYGWVYLRWGMFWGIALKLGFLMAARWWPAFGLTALISALVIGSLVSHMPGKQRHWIIIPGRP